MPKRSIAIVLGASLSFTAIAGALQAQAPSPPATLWNFLGIPQGLSNMRSQLVNRRGNTPGLEKKPPLKNIADPANLESDVPAIKAAAEIKQAEDLKAQKIKAIKYLAEIGCGCYDKDEKVTKALLAAMDDCTEDVRLAAVEAISEAAEGECCMHCSERSCCNEKIVEQLSTIAYERDENGCFVEPSERVREAATEALCVCCPGQGAPSEPMPAIEGDVELEGIEGADSGPPVPAPLDEALLIPPPRRQSGEAIETEQRDSDTHLVSSRRRVSSTSPQSAAPVPPRQNNAGAVAPVYEKVHGTVANVNLRAGLVHLHLPEGKTLPPGATVKVHHRFLSGTNVSAVLQVIDSQPGMADARPVSRGRAPKIARGDEIVAWR